MELEAGGLSWSRVIVANDSRRTALAVSQVASLSFYPGVSGEVTSGWVAVRRTLSTPFMSMHDG